MIERRTVITALRGSAVITAAFALLTGCASSGSRTVAAPPGRFRLPTDGAPIPPRLLAESRPIGRGIRFQPPVTGPVLGACRRGLGGRFGVHVEVFGANRVVIVPAGIGVRAPIGFAAGRISSAGCYGGVVTVDPTGLVLVRRGQTASLADLFRAWGQPLSPRRLASFTGRIVLFVNGRRWNDDPGAVPLTRHSEIVAEAGPYVPPHSAYAFPPGL